jgi:hypothetical protein
VVRWIEGAAMTTSELGLKAPALLSTSAIDLMLAVVPLHFQLPPMSAFAIFLDISIGVWLSGAYGTAIIVEDSMLKRCWCEVWVDRYLGN